MRVAVFSAVWRRGHHAAALVALALFLLVVSLAAASAAEPVRQIVVFGDSQAQGVAAGLQRAFVRDRTIHIIDKTVPGTGLSQKQQYDWQNTVQQFLDKEQPAVAIVMFGGNDRLAARIEATGKLAAYRTEAWRSMYVEQIEMLLKRLNTAHVPVIWLGQPMARDAVYTSDMEFLNAIYAEAVPRSGADYVPLWDIVVDETGGFTMFGKGLDGQVKRLRQDDGVHFMPAGYDIIVNHIREKLDSHLKPSPAPAPVTGMAARS